MKSWWMTLALVGGVAVNAVSARGAGLWFESGGTVPVAGVVADVQEQDGDGPGECWDVYVEEAIEAYMDYEDCMAGEQWWDLAGQSGCALIYEMRAIGAFSWWVTCVGFRS